MKKAKLKKKDVSKVKVTENKLSFKSVLITLIIIIIVLVGFYFLTEKLLVNYNSTESTEESNTTVDVRGSNSINYSNIDDIEDENYYLLIDKSDDESNDTYDMYINSLKYNSFSYEFYYIDLADDNNKDLLTDEESLDDLDKIKVKDTTLLYIEDGKISAKYVGSDAIIEHLSSFFATSNSNSNSNSDSNSNSNSNSD